MGLFNKILNYVTGGSARVDIDIPQASISIPFPATVKAAITEHDLQADKVYLLIRCQEHKKSFQPAKDGKLTDNEKILSELDEWDTETIYRKKVDVAPAQLLKKGNTYSWDVAIDLTDAKKPTMQDGEYKITWEFHAAIDVPGNDPDSGWVALTVTK
ncbi:MAG: hypothetical protein OEX02_20160 [Cyclobacteriaceae bacterium]|nr:hypothetical protein [Cyclobacteriaceae bacterium]